MQDSSKPTCPPHTIPQPARGTGAAPRTPRASAGGDVPAIAVCSLASQLQIFPRDQMLLLCLALPREACAWVRDRGDACLVAIGSLETLCDWKPFARADI